MILFSVKDDTGTLIGEFCSITGLSGEANFEEDGAKFNKLTLHAIKGKEKIYKLCKSSRKVHNPIELIIQVHSFRGTLLDELSLHYTIPILDCENINNNIYEIYGVLNKILPRDILHIWDIWEKEDNTLKGRWVNLDFEQRRAWLHTVHSHAANNNLILSKTKDPIYELEGKNISDYSSFYCALGEAINGPRGYFGANLDGLRDVLLDGLDGASPFRLIWKNSDVARKNLNREAWDKEWEVQDKQLLHDYNDSTNMNIANRNMSDGDGLFESVFEMLIESGINVQLK